MAQSGPRLVRKKHVPARVCRSLLMLTVTVENGVSTIQPASPVEPPYAKVNAKPERTMDKKHPVGILKKSPPRPGVLTEHGPPVDTYSPPVDTYSPPVDTYSPPVDTCSPPGTLSRRRSDGDLLDLEEEPTPMSPHGPPPRASTQRGGTDPEIVASAYLVSGTGHGRAVTIPFQDSHIGPSPIKQQRSTSTMKRHENKAVPPAHVQSGSGKGGAPVNEMAVRAAMLWNSVVDHLYCAGVPNPAPDAAESPLPRPRNPSPHHLRRKSSESNPLYRLEKAILMEIPDSTLSSHNTPDRRQHRMGSPRRATVEVVRDPHHYNQSWNRGRARDRGQRSPYKRQVKDLQGHSSHNTSRSPHKREPLLRKQTTTEIVFERPDTHHGSHHKPRSHSTHRAQHKDKKRRDKTRRTQSHSPQRNVQVQTYEDDLQDDEETSHLIRHEGYPYDNDEGEDSTGLGTANPVYPGRAQPLSNWVTAEEDTPVEPTYREYVDRTGHPEMAGKRGRPPVLPPDASPQRDEVYNPLVRPDQRNPKMSQYRGGGRPVQLMSPGGSIPEESAEDVLGLDSPRAESPQQEQNSSSGRGSLNNERPWIAFHDSSDSSPVRTVTGRVMSPSRRMHVAAQVHHATETSSADSSPVRLASYSIPRVQNVSMKQVHQPAFQTPQAKEDGPRIEFTPTKKDTPPSDSGLTVHVTPAQGSKTTSTESEEDVGFQQKFDSITPAKESLPKRSVARQIMFFEQMSKSTGSSNSADPDTDVPISLI
ncbi:uncharacterized protein LOC144904131 isoform X1 [Branchiostoma floridae x Branchiostoma belcheri]